MSSVAELIRLTQDVRENLEANWSTASGMFRLAAVLASTNDNERLDLISLSLYARTRTKLISELYLGKVIPFKVNPQGWNIDMSVLDSMLSS